MGFFQNLFNNPNDPTGGNLTNALLAQVGGSLMGSVDFRPGGQGINLAPAFQSIGNALMQYQQGLDQHSQMERQRKMDESLIAYREFQVQSARDKAKADTAAFNADLMSVNKLSEVALDLGLVESLDEAKALGGSALRQMIKTRRNELDDDRYYGGYKIPAGATGPEDAVRMVPESPESPVSMQIDWETGQTFNPRTGAVRPPQEGFQFREKDEGESDTSISRAEFQAYEKEVLNDILNKQGLTDQEDRRELVRNEQFQATVRRETIERLLKLGKTIEDIPEFYRNPEQFRDFRIPGEAQPLSVQEQLDQFIKGN